MIPDTIGVQRWVSDDEQSEEHAYVRSTMQYVAGRNPELVPDRLWESILMRAEAQLREAGEGPP